ncbi:MAG: hypothetical protein NTY42_07270 [Planctomycetota bacterium]|nr:hypothetical protein [Planctomycetota bacterium]
MANNATRQGNEATAPMGKSTVPVLFSLKNVQPLILGASAVSPSKSMASSTADVVKASVSGGSTPASAVPSPPVLENIAVLSRPSKVSYGSQILRTVGTLLLILLVITVVRMSVPSRLQDDKIATQKATIDASADQQKTTEAKQIATSQVATSQVVVPPLPKLAASSLDLGTKNETTLVSPSNGMDSGLSGGEANSSQASSIAKRDVSSGIELSSSPVPTLLAAAPTPAAAAVDSSSAFPNRLQSERPAVPWTTLGETILNEKEVEPYTNAPSSEAPYTATRPELYSTNEVRETSTPNLDSSVKDLITLYQNAKGNPVSGNSVPAKQLPSSSPVTPAQTTSFAPQSATPYIPTTPYAPLSTATNWPTNSTATPGSNVGSVARSEAILASAPVNNDSLPMAGQSYPPSPKTYEPLTVPAYEQPNVAAGMSQNGMNRYQSTLNRQPDGGRSAPITQPKLPYTPVGPAAAGSAGSSFGYPPINVPSN